MIELTFDLCLLHINQIELIKFINQSNFIEFINQSNFINHFKLIDIQTNDTLILADDNFVELEERKLIQVALTFKKRKKLISIISIKFNDELIILADNDNDKSLLLTQSKQFDQIRLIDVKISINLTSSREEIRKMITLKDQYIVQRANRVYIVIVSQSETSFDFFFDAQIINSKEDDAKRLNQRLQWQLKNLIRDFRFVSLDNQNQLKLMIFYWCRFRKYIRFSQSDRLRDMFDERRSCQSNSLIFDQM